MAILTGNVVNGKFTPRFPINFGYSPIDADKYDSCQLKVAQYNKGLTVAQRSGAVQLTADRTSGYAMTSWDGNSDTAIRVDCLNRAANTVARGGLLGLYVYTRQYSGGNIANMYGASISVDERGTSDGTASVSTAISLLVALRINGVCQSAAHVAVFQDNSQGTISASTCTGAALVKFQSTQPVASGIRPTCLHFETTGSGTGWTHAFSFQTAAGKEGFTAVSAVTAKGNIDGYIKVYDVATAQTLYLLLYDTVPS